MTPEELALYNQLLLSNKYLYVERLGLNQDQRKKKWTWNLEFIKQKNSLWFLDSSVTFIKRLARKFLIICQCQKKNKKSYLQKLVKSTLTTFSLYRNQNNIASFFLVLKFFKNSSNQSGQPSAGTKTKPISQVFFGILQFWQFQKFSCRLDAQLR